MARTRQAKVAKLVEHSTENAGVISSILILGTFSFLDKYKSTSSSLRSPSKPTLLYATSLTTATLLIVTI